MSEIIQFNCEKFSIIKEDPRFIVCKFYFGLIGENENGSVLLKEDYENNKDTVGYTPICGYFRGNDFDEHHPKEVPLGGLLSFADCEYSYETFDNKEYATAIGIIYKEYLPKESNNIIKNLIKKISIELEVLEKEKLISGKFRFKKWIYQCITVLGDRYKQGMGDAHLEVLNNARERYAVFVNKTIETFSKNKTDFPKSGDNQEITLRNSNYPQFDYEYAVNLKENYPTIWSKGGNIRGNEAFQYWTKFRNDDISDGVLSWIKEREAWAARHNKDSRLAGIVANIKWGTIVSRGENYMKDIIEEEKNKIDSQKSEKFDSDENKNKDGDTVKIEFTKATEKFNLNSSQIEEILTNALAGSKYTSGDYEGRKYYTRAFDDEFVYVYNCELGVCQRMKYEMTDNVATIDFESAEEVISGGYIPVNASNEGEGEGATEEFTLEQMTQMYTDLKAQYDDMCGKYSANEDFAKTISEKEDFIIEMGKQIDGFKAELETLKAEMVKKDEMISNYAKKEKETMAKEIIAQYSEKLTDAEQENFVSKLDEFADMDSFKKEIKAFVCDKYEDEIKGKVNTSTFSYLGIDISGVSQPKKGESWTDYIDEYKI